MAAFKTSLDHLEGFEAVWCHVSTEIELLKLRNQGQLVELVVVYHEHLRLVDATVFLQMCAIVINHRLKIVQKVFWMHDASCLLL